MATTASHAGIEGTAAARNREERLRLPPSTPVPSAVGQAPTRDLDPAFRSRKVLRPAPPRKSAGDPSGAGQRVARNLGALVGGQLVTWTMTLVWTLIVPRILGPVDFGILVSAQSVGGVLCIALGVGAQAYLTRETVVDGTVGCTLIGTALILRIALVPVVGLAAILWARLAHYGHDATLVLYLITGMTAFTLLLEPVQAAFQAIERMKYIAYANVINKVAQSLIGIALVLVGVGVVGIAADMALTAGVVLLLSWLWLRPYFRINVATNASLMAHVTKESASFWVYSVFGMVYLWIDTIMLTLMTRSYVVGWYGASTQLFQTLMFLPVFVQTAWLPRLVAAFGKSRRDLHEAARAPVELILTVSLPIAAGTVVVADALIHAVYGPSFSHAAPVLMILGLCIPPIYLNNILAPILVAEKRQALWTFVMIGAAVLNPLINLALIPWTQARYHNGAIGAAISLVLTELAINGVGLILVGRHVFERRMLKRCALMFVASAAMVGVARVLQPVGMAASIIAGFTTFGLLVVCLRVIHTEELALARVAIGRVRARIVRKRRVED